MLFIDQPNLVGFSYDVPTNLSVNLITGEYHDPPKAQDAGVPSYTYLNGTFPSAGPNQASANTTEIAAVATWHFLQTWLSTFTQYNPATRPNVTTTNADVPAGISLFTESYGGKYGPVFASYFEDQNEAIASGALSRTTTLPIRVQSVGIMNGIMDDLIQNYYYPEFAYNNTYGIDIISQTQQLNALNDYKSACVPAINACRTAAVTDSNGEDERANELCRTAQTVCNDLTALIGSTEYYPYDIRQKIPTPDPPASYQEYLNSASVLGSIGARVNYTESNLKVYNAFMSTGDTIRGGIIQDLADLLQRGVRVALVYGDADYLCNWLGGQAVAFAIADALQNSSVPASGIYDITPAMSYSAGFAKAGFADIVVNDSYVGGAVRQYGNLSFSRIYDAGHFVPYYQPETAFQVFARVLFGKDLSFGGDVDLATFVSNGTANATHTNTVPDAPGPTCWLRSWNSSCSQDDMDTMINGQGVAEFGIFYQDKDDVSRPSQTVAAGIPGSPMITPVRTSDTKAKQSEGSTTVVLTGFYTATATPKPTKGAGVCLDMEFGLGIFGLGLILLDMMM
jgi:carboxypeptidase C (cathepsin A)